MYFTKTDNGFRGWFSLVLNNGTLRANSVSSSFTALIVNQADTTSSLMTVTQSQQKEGLYRFDIPNTFLLAHGSGEYGISVEVLESASPKITTAFSNVLKVSNEDFDSLATAVWNVSSSDNNVSGTFGWEIQNIASDLDFVVTATLSGVAVDVDTLVSGVWNAHTASFNTNGSMGWVQNQLYDNILTIVSGNIEILTNTNVIVSATNDLVYSASQIYNNTTYILSDLLTVVSATTSGTILTNETITNIVTGVWQAATASYNVSGTMGWLQNLIYNIENDTNYIIASGSFGLSGAVEINLESVNTIISGVWDAAANTFNTSGTMGYLENMIDDIKADTTEIGNDTLLLISGTLSLIDNVDEILVTSSLTYNNTNNILNSFTSGTIELGTGSIQTIVSGVWGAASGAYDTSGTMGWLQNRIGATEISASVTVDNAAIAAAVWNQLTASNTTPGTFGYTVGNLSLTNIANTIWDENLSVHDVSGSIGLALQNIDLRIREIYQIMGLELGEPMTVTQTLRTVAAISQSICGDPATAVTVSRLP